MPDTDPKPLTVAVIGAGVIGASVAFACARAGHAVILIDRDGKAWARVKRDLNTYRRRLRLKTPAAPSPNLANIVMTEDIAAVRAAEMIVENVPERWDDKQAVYAALRDLNLTHVTIAANTSAIPITRLATLAPEPAQVVGLHFMNPVDQIDMVEIVRGDATATGALEAVTRFLASLGKTGVLVGDAPGFVINRILMVMISQAAQLLSEGVATAYEIDQLFKRCLGHAAGPLRTADLIGIDTVVDTLRVLDKAYGGEAYKPAGRLAEMVAAGRLGIKAGEGFYLYDTEE